LCHEQQPLLSSSPSIGSTPPVETPPYKPAHTIPATSAEMNFPMVAIVGGRDGERNDLTRQH
jgi:hypothetical protein